METHDFGDGSGQILAHRHINPDSAFGGWVPDAWNVAPDMYVAFTSAHVPLWHMCVDEILSRGVSVNDEIEISFEVDEVEE